MPWERRAFYANGSDTRIGFSLGRGRRRLPLLDHDVEGDECALDAAAVDAVLDGFLRDVVGDAVRAQHLEPLGQVEAAGRIRRHALEADLAFLADDANAELAVVELVERVVLKKSLREALGVRPAKRSMRMTGAFLGKPRASVTKSGAATVEIETSSLRVPRDLPSSPEMMWKGFLLPVPLYVPSPRAC